MDSIPDEVLDLIVSLNAEPCLNTLRRTSNRWKHAVFRIQWTHECVVYKLRLWRQVCPNARYVWLMQFDEYEAYEEAALRTVRNLCISATIGSQLLSSLTNLNSLVLESSTGIYGEFTPPPNLTILVIYSRFHLHEGELYLLAHYECSLKDLNVNLRHLEAPTSFFCPSNISRLVNIQTLILSVGCDELQDKHFAKLTMLRVLHFGRAPLLTIDALSHLALDEAKGTCPGICSVCGNVNRLTVLRAAIYAPPLRARRINHLDIFGDIHMDFIEGLSRVVSISLTCDVPYLYLWALRVGASIHHPPGY